MRAVALALFLLILGCPSFAPLSTSLPEGTRPDVIYLAALRDYDLFSADVNAYLRLPSTSVQEAHRIDALLDRLEERIRQVEAARVAGVASGDQYWLAIAALQAATREICVNSGGAVSASCAER